MNRKLIYAIFSIVVLSSLVFAMSGATTTFVQERGRWNGTGGANNRTIEGGNITGVNVNAGSNALTEKWASFYGNVSGAIRLTDSSGAADVYSWSWSDTNGGEVCLSKDSGFSWASAATTTALEVDTAFNFGTAPDNATSTYNDASCNLTINEVAGAITSTGTPLQGSSTFTNCVLEDTATPGTSDFAFCTLINATGTNWNNEASDYEIMVPTNHTAGATETYFFFMELN